MDIFHAINVFFTKSSINRYPLKVKTVVSSNHTHNYCETDKICYKSKITNDYTYNSRLGQDSGLHSERATQRWNACTCVERWKSRVGHEVDDFNPPVFNSIITNFPKIKVFKSSYFKDRHLKEEKLYKCILLKDRKKYHVYFIPLISTCIVVWACD